MKNVELDDYQKEALAHNGNLLLCTGRQSGKTFIVSLKAAHYMIDHPGSSIIIVSLTEDQAKLIIVRILDYIEKLDKKLIAKGKNKPTQNKVTLVNKSWVLARPVGNTGEAVRGFTADVLIIDEASRMSQLVWDSSRPTLLTTQGQIWMCSTPYGKQGYFWEAYQNKDNRYKVIHVSSEEVIRNRKLSESWTEEQRESALRFLEQERKDMSVVSYGQEYLGLFLDELRQYFDDELIERVCILSRDQNHPGYKFLGCDIARMGDDETTYEVIAKQNDKYYHIESLTTKKTRLNETEDRIILLDKMYNFSAIGIDAGSGMMGVSIWDHLILVDGIKRKIRAMNNRALSLDREGKKVQRLQKEDYYDNLKGMMERGEIKLLNDENVKLSLKSVQIERVEEDDKMTRIKISGKYTHHAEGIVRAAFLAKKEKNLNLWFKYL